MKIENKAKEKWKKTLRILYQDFKRKYPNNEQSIIEFCISFLDFCYMKGTIVKTKEGKYLLPDIIGNIEDEIEEARLRHIDLGVHPDRLRPAKDKENLMADLMVEHAAIIRTLVESYIDMRDNHGGRPFESVACRKARESYRASNDTVEQFFHECLARDETGKIAYADLREAWIEFTGDQKATTREVVEKVIKRFKWTEAKRSHGVRSVYGIIAKTAKDNSEISPKEEPHQNEIPF